MVALPEYIDKELWSAFVSQRQAMKVPFTQQAQKLVVRKLMKLHADGYDVNQALEKAAIYGYRSVFADDTMKVKKQATTQDAALEKIKRDAAIAKPMPESIRKQLELLRHRV